MYISCIWSFDADVFDILLQYLLLLLGFGLFCNLKGLFDDDWTGVIIVFECLGL